MLLRGPCNRCGDDVLLMILMVAMIGGFEMIFEISRSIVDPLHTSLWGVLIDPGRAGVVGFGESFQ